METTVLEAHSLFLINHYGQNSQFVSKNDGVFLGELIWKEFSVGVVSSYVVEGAAEIIRRVCTRSIFVLSHIKCQMLACVGFGCCLFVLMLFLYIINIPSVYPILRIRVEKLFF